MPCSKPRVLTPLGCCGCAVLWLCCAVLWLWLWCWCGVAVLLCGCAVEWYGYVLTPRGCCGCAVSRCALLLCCSVEAALGALLSLADSPGPLSALAGSGCVHLAVAAMQVHPDRCGVQLAAVRLLWNTCALPASVEDAPTAGDIAVSCVHAMNMRPGGWMIDAPCCLLCPSLSVPACTPCVRFLALPCVTL